MAEHGKRYRECVEKLPDPEEKVGVADGVAKLQTLPQPKFDQTMELCLHLRVDPKQADQNIRGAVSLPHGIGAARKVVAFCEGEDVEKARAAGAVEAGSDELIEKVQGGWTDFDVAVATPAMMKSVSRLGRILGPAGKMPSPKAGTVVDDVETAVTEYSAGKVEFRNDPNGNLHVPVGKVSFETQKLIENVEAFVAHIRRLRPVSVRGEYIRKASLSLTMSPSVELAV